jgi:hypothetical protein
VRLQQLSLRTYARISINKSACYLDIVLDNERQRSSIGARGPEGWVLA